MSLHKSKQWTFIMVGGRERDRKKEYKAFIDNRTTRDEKEQIRLLLR